MKVRFLPLHTTLSVRSRIDLLESKSIRKKLAADATPMFFSIDAQNQWASFDTNERNDLARIEIPSEGCLFSLAAT